MPDLSFFYASSCDGFARTIRIRLNGGLALKQEKLMARLWPRHPKSGALRYLGLLWLALSCFFSSLYSCRFRVRVMTVARPVCDQTYRGHSMGAWVNNLPQRSDFGVRLLCDTRHLEVKRRLQSRSVSEDACLGPELGFQLGLGLALEAIRG